MLDIDVFIGKIKKKSRLIGIDPGGKRIGIAISDENKIVATPYTTLIKENYKDGKSDGNLEEYSFGGQLRLKGNHINGKREGLWEWFNENGSYFKTETYKDGEKID